MQRNFELRDSRPCSLVEHRAMPSYYAEPRPGNGETPARAAAITAMQLEPCRALAMTRQSWTKPLRMIHGFTRPGIIEVAPGITWRAVIDAAGGSRDGRTLAGVLVGGATGRIVWAEEWDTALGSEDFELGGGPGGIAALPEATDWRALLVQLLELLADESSDRCVPCRLGTKGALRQAALGGSDAQARIESILDVMEDGSLCALGRSDRSPVRRILTRFGASLWERPTQ